MEQNGTKWNAEISVLQRVMSWRQTQKCLIEQDYHLSAFLDAMLDYLTPTDVVVYGSFNSKYIQQYGKYTNFHVLPDWISYKRGDHNGDK